MFSVSIHNKEKRFHCTKWDYVAYLNCDVKQHVASVHNKEKRFQCTKCDYAASQNCNIKEHVVSIHNKENRLHCTKCYYAASQNGNLKQHVASIHKKTFPLYIPLYTFWKRGAILHNSNLQYSLCHFFCSYSFLGNL